MLVGGVFIQTQVPCWELAGGNDGGEWKIKVGRFTELGGRGRGWLGRVRTRTPVRYAV